MADLTQIQFIHEDATRIISEMKSDMEQRLNRQISPADIEMLLIQGFAYREMIIRAGVNDTGRQSLVDFARGIMLDYLGVMQGVRRLPAAGALCQITFQLVPGHTGITIPQGLRVQSMDGKVIFQTIEEKTIVAGTLTAIITAACSTPGIVGNDYALNTISIILDPQAFISTGGNTSIPTGGADEETDNELRERIKLAPASFSVAGPTDAYKYFAKSAHPSIVDVAVTSPVPGQINIYPLLEGGIMPNTEILDAVQAICNADKIRPLSDTVVTAAPTAQNYAINVELTLLTTALGSQVLSEVNARLNDLIDKRKNRLGIDVVRNKIASLCMVDGKVYDVSVISPAADIVAGPNIYTKNTGITVSIVGTHDE